MNRVTFFLMLIFLSLMLFQCKQSKKQVIAMPHVLDCSVLQQDSVLITKMQLTVKDRNILTNPDSIVLYKIINNRDISEKKRKAQLGVETMSILNYYLLSGNNFKAIVDQPITISKETAIVVFFKTGKTIELHLNNSLDTVTFKSLEKTTMFLLSDNKLFKKLLRILQQDENK